MSVAFEVGLKSLDAAGENRDLNFRGAGVALVAAVLTLELGLVCEGDAHELNASWRRWSDRRVVRMLEI